MNNLSIFAKPAFLNTNPYSPFEYKGVQPRNGHLQRVSSMIRGKQVAEYTGAKLNPDRGYDTDVCIYVKPMIRKGDDIELKGKKSYLDIIDGHNLGQVALKHPDTGVIVCSKADYETMSKCIPNEIVFIPQHHCNFERYRKPLGEIKTIGVIGTKGAFKFLPKGLKESLLFRGIELLQYDKFFSREDIINFYKKIDLQVVWRPYKKRLSNPLKLVNAASFGVPTVALDEKAFKELDGCYIPVARNEDLIPEIEKLVKNRKLYIDYSIKCWEKAEEYHIENVANLYRNLCTI